MNHDRFIINRMIGKGNFGTTYLAYDKTLKKNIALKIILLRNEKEKNAAFEEIEILKNLSNHGNCSKYIVCYYDSFVITDDGTSILYIIFEYIDGITLEEYITKNIYVPLNILLSLIYGLVAGLLYIHTKMYAHRDIKLDNIMITNDGQIKYIDFGLACRLISDRDDTCKNNKFISLLYSSPDFYRTSTYNLNISQSNDVWSLGVVIFRLANGGKLPFDTDQDIIKQSQNILNAPKYHSEYHSYPDYESHSDVNNYINSFLVNNYEMRPSIHEQYNRIIELIDKNKILKNKNHDVIFTPTNDRNISPVPFLKYESVYIDQ